MLLDKQMLMQDNEALSLAGAGTYLGLKSVDTGVAGTDAFGNTVIHDAGRGKDLIAFIEVLTAITSGGAATVQFQLVQADDAALTTNVNILCQTDVMPKATLFSGYRARSGKEPAGVTRRFLGIQYVVGTAALTAGNVTSALAMDDNTSLPSVG